MTIPDHYTPVLVSLLLFAFLPILEGVTRLIEWSKK